MSEAKRLHPIAAVTNFVKQLKELILPFLAFLVFGANSADGNPWWLLSSVVIVVFVLVSGIVYWRKFTYRLEEGELRIEYGWLVRKKRYIPFERIQSLDLSESILHRPFGLVKVKVETAGSSGAANAEAELTAITKAEAMFIEETIAKSKGAAKRLAEDGDDDREEPLQVQSEVIYQITGKQLLLLATTSGGVGVVLSAVFAFLSQFDQVIPYERIFHEFKHIISSGVAFVAIIVLIGFLIAWVLALIGTMLKYAHFTVRKTERDLIISQGWLEKRQITIPLNRIQAIRISENWIRQPLKLCSVQVVSAGGSAQNAESSKVLVLPLVSKQQVRELLSPHLPAFDFENTLEPLPKRALMHYLLEGLVWTAPLVIVISAVFRPWGLLSLLVLPIMIGWCYLMFKDAGWSVQGRQLTIRYRSLIKHTLLVRKNKIQSMHQSEGPLQMRNGLATVTCWAKTGSGGMSGTVAHLEKEHAEAIYAWYSYEKAPE